ncbi:uncharacterized protein LOC133895216 [Phragmites australis]|uniref:uncharacterized protein LOC133895216 n=1 Tax=Phragmites australis TaxID=29695 RepID=UPI002D77B8FE|nr:uncharacterized protein LOC133895216 [Phragmites australis]
MLTAAAWKLGMERGFGAPDEPPGLLLPPRRPPADPVQPRLPGATPPRPPGGYRTPCPLPPHPRSYPPLPPPPRAPHPLPLPRLPPRVVQPPRAPHRPPPHWRADPPPHRPTRLQPRPPLRRPRPHLDALRPRTVQYCRLGATEWRVASISKPYRFDESIFVNGTLNAVVAPGYRPAVVELPDNNSNSSVELAFLGGELDPQALHPHEAPVLYLYLAECRGELILISAAGLHQRVYHAFRWNNGEAKWVRITSLGGCTLFFAHYRFAGCLGPDHPGIRGDCIYFTQKEGRWCEYSLVDGSSDEFVPDYPGGIVMSGFSAPTWVFPSRC